MVHRVWFLAQQGEAGALASVLQQLSTRRRWAENKPRVLQQALRVAAVNDHADAASVLLQAGADGDAGPNDLNSALWLACCTGGAATVRTLLAAKTRIPCEHFSIWRAVIYSGDPSIAQTCSAPKLTRVRETCRPSTAWLA